MVRISFDLGGDLNDYLTDLVLQDNGKIVVTEIYTHVARERLRRLYDEKHPRA